MARDTQKEFNEIIKLTPIDIRLTVEVQCFLLDQKNKGVEVTEDVMELLVNICNELKEWKEQGSPV